MTIEFIAEIGSNHNQDLDRAVQLIHEAKKIGCTGVKFQYFKADKLWNKDKFPAEYENAKKCELNSVWLPTLAREAKSQGLLFGMSVFDPKDVEFLNQYVNYFKIASFEAGYLDLVKACYETGKRLMISTGQISKSELFSLFCNLPQIDVEAGTIGLNIHIDILHCVSKYPAKIEDCNLNIIRNNPVINGYSDHTTDQLVVLSAVALGAKVIEFHFDIDTIGWEWGHSWYPIKAQNVIIECNKISEMLGSGDWDTFYNQQDLRYKINPKTGKRGI